MTVVVVAVAKSESEMTSVEASSSSPAAAYYVESPWHADDATPLDSPSHAYSYAPARFSANWPKRITDRHVINHDSDSYLRHRRFQFLIALLAFLLIFSLFCLILWAASTPFTPIVSLQSYTVHSFYFGAGTDMTGVPTKLVTVNCSVRMNVYNPATFFGIHVTSSPINLMYSDLAVAQGQLERYYQPRKSNRTVIANVQGIKVPLYGAGATWLLDKDSQVPMTLLFELRSKGHVVGKLVKSSHKRRVTCSLDIDSRVNKPTRFERGSCLFE